MNNICLIPARSGSKRVLKKNIVEFCGKAMITYTIEAAIRSKLFGEHIYISSDSEEILNTTNVYQNVQKILRPQELATDITPLESVAIHLLQNVPQKFNYLCMLMPNCPLRTSEDIKKSYEILLQTRANCLMSVVDYHWLYPFWALQEKNGVLKNYFEEKYKKDSKKLPKNIYCPSGAIRWVKIDNFLKEKKFYGKNLFKYEIQFERSIDIDTYKDLELAKKLYKII